MKNKLLAVAITMALMSYSTLSVGETPPTGKLPPSGEADKLPPADEADKLPPFR